MAISNGFWPLNFSVESLALRSPVLREIVPTIAEAVLLSISIARAKGRSRKRKKTGVPTYYLPTFFEIF
jgi:hypothetical protein